MPVLWLGFIVCAGLIVYCGTNLSRYGDVIAGKTGLGHAWTGLILMAGITSLPELISGISSVTIAGVPDIALGDIMGSCMFNILIIAFMDMLLGRKQVFSGADKSHFLSLSFGMILIGVVSVSILLPDMPSIGPVGIYTPVIALIYLAGIKSVWLFEKKRAALSPAGIPADARYDHISLRKAVSMYSLNAVVIVAAATLLPFIGERLAQQTGLGDSFVGTFLIGMATSLPELVVSISALHIGATQMAIANIFGSNMFNILIIAIDDIFYAGGGLLSVVSTGHAITGLMAMIMSAIAMIGLTYRPKKKLFLILGWDSASLILAYAISIWSLYSFGAAG